MGQSTWGRKKIAKMAKQVTYELDREQLFRPVRSQWVNPVPEYLRELPNATSPVEKEAYENLGKVTSDPLIGANSVSRVYYKINPAALSTSSKVFAQKTLLVGVRYASAAALWAVAGAIGLGYAVKGIKWSG